MNCRGMNRYLILSISLLLASCAEKAPPKGFEAVVPLEQDQTRRDCPNLIDIYSLTHAQEQNILLEKPIDGKNFSYLIISSLVARESYDYALRMDSYHFLNNARKLATDDPKKYSQWRESTLRLSKGYSEETFADVLKYGSAYERQGYFRIYECSKGWVKVKEIETSAWDEKTDQNYVRQDDAWLARNQYGDLLIHTISYQQKPGWTFWAASGGGVRLIRINDQWDKIKKAPDANFTMAWTEADLPAIKIPISNISECRPLSKHEIVDFNQRLLQSGLIIKQFSPNPMVVNDGACTQPSLQLGFLSKNSTEAKSIIKLLEEDPVVDNVELLETRADSTNLHYLVQVKFH